ncbi:MAG: ABC transporter permease [Polyangiaceae bacterium]
MRARLLRILAEPWAGPLLALVVVYLVFAALTPATFLQPIALEMMARHTVVVALAAIGMTLVIVEGGIDLSVGSVVALVTVVTARALKSGSSPIVAVLIGVATGVIAGALNGSLVSLLRITPFIVTLGTMSVLRGLAKGLANEQKIDADTRAIEPLMDVVPRGSLRVLPYGAWIAASLAVVATVVLQRTRFGRHVVAVGSSTPTARLAGISIPRVTVLVYALAGLLAGIAGVLELATLSVGDPTDSIGLELKVIAAVVIGGGSLSGGQGSIAGSLIGAMLMTVIATGATHLGIANWIQEILTGLIIVIAVTLDAYRARRPRSVL